MNTLQLIKARTSRTRAMQRARLQMAKALKHLRKDSVALSYSEQNEQVDEFRSLALPSLEIKTFRTAFEALSRSLLLPNLQKGVNID